MAGSIVRSEGEGEKLWFYGGGVHTWKATAAETDGAFILVEDELVKGKTTPLHRHPDHDEMLYVIEGELLVRGSYGERRVGRGATIVNPRGVEHAFLVVSDTARVLFLQTPGSAEAFYRGASAPIAEGEKVDFRKLAEVAKDTGQTEILGPPPFGKPDR